MESIKGQLTLRGIIIGSVGCVVITLTSAYVALKMGALPWPIIFAAVVSLFFLRLCGSKSLNEANVTHTIMSSGAMVAGGLAFTIPGIWILQGETVSYWEMFLVAFFGVVFGVICSVVFRKYFIEEVQLEFPIGDAAAQTLIAGDKGGKTAATLFSAMGLSGIWTFLRDGLGAIPALFCSTTVFPGVSFAIYNSPMMLAVGALVGFVPALVWFIGALVGNMGLIAGGSTLGWWSVEAGQGFSSSLGMGVMMGCGVAVVIKNSIPWIKSASRHLGFSEKTQGKKKDKVSSQKNNEVVEESERKSFLNRKQSVVLIVLLLTALSLLLCFMLKLGALASVVVVIFVWITSAMAAQCVGQTGIDPMEIFGLLVLLVVAALSDIPQVQLFFVAGIIAVTCGLAGDVMNDFRAGYVLGTDPKAQWIGQTIGGILGAFVAALALFLLVSAYGTEAFGINGSFVATQASVVAAMVGGIPSLPWFGAGFVLGLVLYFTGLPIMLLGLGIYLPFYLSFTAFLGAFLRFVYDLIIKRSKGEEGQSKHNALLVASGFLGGESIVGVIVAFVVLVSGIGI